jgi:hypothetical protein
MARCTTESKEPPCEIRALRLRFRHLPLLLIGVRPGRAQHDASSAAGFGADYSSLQPQQNRLIEDWFKRVQRRC